RYPHPLPPRRSSDLEDGQEPPIVIRERKRLLDRIRAARLVDLQVLKDVIRAPHKPRAVANEPIGARAVRRVGLTGQREDVPSLRSEEHTSELQSREQ